MDTKIIALDLDGTLLNSQESLSTTTIETLQQIKKQGHKIIITTGRPYRSALPYYQTLGLDTPMITFNGALVSLPGRKWKYEREYTVEKRILIDLLNRGKEIKMDFLVSEYRKKFFIHQETPNTLDPKLLGVREITSDQKLQPHKITKNPNALLIQTRSLDKDKLAIDLMADYAGELTVSSWGGPLNILECTPKGINKAHTLSYLLGVYNKTSNDLFAFGDQLNDKEMLAFAGHGFAMNNAHPQLLDFAKQQISLTNDQDGVAKTLQELFL